MHHMFDFERPFEFFHFGYGGIFMWIFWIIIVSLIIFLAIKYYNGSLNINKKETPLDIAKKRYARGEITKEELDEIKKNL